MKIKLSDKQKEKLDNYRGTFATAGFITGIIVTGLIATEIMGGGAGIFTRSEFGILGATAISGGMISGLTGFVYGDRRYKRKILEEIGKEEISKDSERAKNLERPSLGDDRKRMNLEITEKNKIPTQILKSPEIKGKSKNPNIDIPL